MRQHISSKYLHIENLAGDFIPAKLGKKGLEGSLISLSQLEKLKEKGVKIGYVTLHVGLGTFRPVKVENVDEHIMHSEYYEISKETIDAINQTKQNNKKDAFGRPFFSRETKNVFACQKLL